MITCEHIAVGHGDKIIVRDINLHLEGGQILLLCGRNGSGKSTLLKTISGQFKPRCGSINTSKVTLLPARLPKIKGFTVSQFVSIGYGNNSWPHSSQQTEDTLQVTDISELSDRDIATLSDGEFQKACIAWALNQGGETLLLDEPTAFLDPDGKHSVLSAVRRISSARGTSFMIASHDIRECLPFADIVAGITPEGCFLSSESMEKEKVIRECFPESYYI